MYSARKPDDLFKLNIDHVNYHRFRIKFLADLHGAIPGAKVCVSLPLF